MISTISARIVDDGAVAIDEVEFGFRIEFSGDPGERFRIKRVVCIQPTEIWRAFNDGVRLPFIRPVATIGHAVLELVKKVRNTLIA
mgnify:CR=1 FL=1